MTDYPLQPAAGKGHVPEENLARYRRLRELGFLFSRLGNMVSGLGEYDDANKIWAMGGKYSRMANELRVDLPASKEILKAQIAESLPDLSSAEVDELYEMGLELGRRMRPETDGEG